MFLKPVNSDMENGFLKKSKMLPEKIDIQRKLETGKDIFLKGTRITRSLGWITSL